MAKLQPSKLIMRVRFPLPAFSNQTCKMKIGNLIKSALFCMSLTLTPAVLAGEGATVGVPDEDIPVAVEKVKGDEKPSVEAPIVLPAYEEFNVEDYCPRLYEILRDDQEHADAILLAIIKQRKNWKPKDLYLIVRTAIIANPSLIDKIVVIMKEAGISDPVIRVIIDHLREDGTVPDTPIGDEFLEQDPIIPTPPPVSQNH